MKFNKNEIYGYLFVVLATLLVGILPVLSFSRPYFVDPINFTPPEQTIDEPPEQEPRPIDLGFLEITSYIIGIILAVLLLYFIIQGISAFQSNLNRQKTPSRRSGLQIRRELEDARIKAYEIIDRGLKTGEYRSAFIEAYIALDTALENFRDIHRPRYVTPKEYAFSVDPPVFQPSVFRFVSTYYRLRYGLEASKKEDLLSFRQELDYLFVEDVPKDIEETWTADFDQAKASDYTFKVPRIIDHKRPGVME